MRTILKFLSGKVTWVRHSLPVFLLAQQRGLMKSNECLLQPWCQHLSDNSDSLTEPGRGMTGPQIVRARVKRSIHVRNHPQSPFVFFLPTACTQSSGLSTPKSCTSWAFGPGWSAPTLWWSSFSPYQIMARTTSGAGACLGDWTAAWTASAMIPDTSEDPSPVLVGIILTAIYSPALKKKTHLLLIDGCVSNCI